MILGMMQPYFLPYVEHFRLIAACDEWVVFDTVPFRKRTWMTRNRLLDLNRPEGWSWVSLPVSGSRDQAIKDVRLDAGTNWRRPIRGRVAVYESLAPHYGVVSALIESVLEEEHEFLVDLNVSLLRAVAGALGIGTPIRRLSDLALELPDQLGAGQWALEVARRLGADEYRNPSGGRHLFTTSEFHDAGVELSFHQHVNITYPTAGSRFVPDLSVVDPLMWLGPHRLREALGH
jgi:hypothetical protein